MEQIKRMREQHGLTQKELAERLDVTEEYIYMIEKGSRSPSTKLAIKMSALFNVTLDEIFFANQSNKTLCNGQKEAS